MRFAVVVFPGTWSDGDCYYVLDTLLGQEVDYVWHRAARSLGLRLRGAAWRLLLRRLPARRRHCALFAGDGGGGRATRRAAASSSASATASRSCARRASCPAPSCATTASSSAASRPTCGRRTSTTPFTTQCEAGQVLKIPISHGDGQLLRGRGRRWRCWRRADASSSATRLLTAIVTPEANPNGSLNNIAGIINERGNVLGMMPHPERASEALMGSEDGLFIWRSILQSAVAALSGSR